MIPLPLHSLKLTSRPVATGNRSHGRIVGDTQDEIRLTLSVSSLFAFPRVDQVHEQQQVLDPYPRSAPAHYLIRIGERGVGPIYRY
jgi:hypothetical protein